MRSRWVRETLGSPEAIADNFVQCTKYLMLSLTLQNTTNQFTAWQPVITTELHQAEQTRSSRFMHPHENYLIFVILTFCPYKII